MRSRNVPAGAEHPRLRERYDVVLREIAVSGLAGLVARPRLMCSARRRQDERGSHASREHE